MQPPKCVKTLSLFSAILSAVYGLLYFLVVLGQKIILPFYASEPIEGEFVFPLGSLVLAFIPIIAFVGVMVWITSKKDGWTGKSATAPLLLAILPYGVSVLFSRVVTIVETQIISAKGVSSMMVYSVINSAVTTLDILMMCGAVLGIVATSILAYHCKAFERMERMQGENTI